MKTLVVLFAVAAIAIAVPLSPDKDFEKSILSQENGAETVKRDTKPPSHEAEPTNAELTSEDTSSGKERHTLLKKKLLLKKKPHLYRNPEDKSEAEPEENCVKKSKAKLCETSNEESHHEMRSSTPDDLDSDLSGRMEHSLQIAKEAVESLQGNLNKMERSFGAKTAMWKNTKSGSDTQLHENIEIARQALEHIQNNIGNLESMNLQTTTLNNPDNMQVKEAKTEEERMAQWKEAMENIQKNVEIARNIEDSFRSEAQKRDNFFGPMKAKSHNSDSVMSSEKDFMRSVNDDNKEDIKFVKHPTHENSRWHHGDKESDMKGTANGELKKQMADENAKTTSNNCNVEEDSATKSPIISIDVSSNTLEKKIINKVPSETNQNTEQEATKSTLPNSTANETDKMSDEDKSDSSESEERHKTKNEMNIGKEKQIIALENTNSSKLHVVENSDTHPEESKNEKGKSAQNTEMKKIELKPKNEDMDNKLTEQHLKDDKNAEKVTGDKEMTVSNHVEQFPKQEADFDMQNGMQSADSLMHDNNKKAENNEKMMEMKSADHIEDAKFRQKSMKSADDLSSMQQLHSDHQEDMTTLMKSAELHNNKFHKMNHDKNFEALHSVKSTDHFGVSDHASSLHSMGSHGMTAHGKSANMDSAMQPSMMDMRSAPVHNRRWKQLHNERGAYGPSLSYGGGSAAPSGPAAPTAGGSDSGAVGLFPNANVGGCAIPLLLSCSPSVVHGTLAKQNSYAAPTYRAEEDFKFHNKRDIKKNYKIPTKIPKKSTRILESL